MMVIPAASAADTMVSVCCSSDIDCLQHRFSAGIIVGDGITQVQVEGTGNDFSQCDAAVDLHRQLAGQARGW